VAPDESLPCRVLVVHHGAPRLRNLYSVCPSFLVIQASTTQQWIPILYHHTIPQENGMGCAFLYDASRADLLSQILHHPSISQNDSASHIRRTLGSTCGRLRLRDRSLFGTDRPFGAPKKPCQGHFNAVALRLRNIAPGLSLPISCI
jgi:hypothetical protein